MPQLRDSPVATSPGSFRSTSIPRPRETSNRCTSRRWRCSAARREATDDVWRDPPLAQIGHRQPRGGTGEDLEVGLDNDRASTTLGDPATWPVVWRDEFDAPAGTAPNPANWTHEIGDGTIIGKPGWGNDELEYYTDSTANAATSRLGILDLAPIGNLSLSVAS